LVADNLPQACAADALETVARAGARKEINADRLVRRAPLAVEKLIAALRFALELETGRNCLHQLACYVEQLRLVPPLEFKLDFAQWCRAPFGVDFAAVNRERDLTRAISHWIGRPLYPRLEHRLELPSEFPPDERLERGAPSQAEIGLRARDFAFPFVALEKSRIPRRLDCLDVAAADAAHAQSQTLFVQLMLIGIEVDGNLGRAPGRALDRPDERDFLETRQARRRKPKLDLDFLWRRHGTSVQRTLRSRLAWTEFRKLSSDPKPV